MTAHSNDDDTVTDLQNQLAALMGRAKALEYGLRLLIAGSQTPNVLNTAWSRMLPELLELHESPDDGNSLYKHALVEGLKVISDQLDEAASPSR